MFNPENYFDLHNILINEIVGSMWLFLVIISIAIVWFCVKYQLNFVSSSMLLITFWLIMVGNYSLLIVKIAVVLAAGMFFYKTLKQFIQASGG